MPLPKLTGFAVVEEIEVWRAANQLVKRYGADAELEAAMRADAMIECGDPEGLAVWKRILRCLSVPRRTGRLAAYPAQPTRGVSVGRGASLVCRD